MIVMLGGGISERFKMKQRKNKGKEVYGELYLIMPIQQINKIYY